MDSRRRHRVNPATITAFMAVVLCLIGVALQDLISEELRGSLARLPSWFLKLASRRLDPEMHDDVLREWEAELQGILADPALQGRPISRLVTGIRYSVGHLRAAAATSRSFRGGKLSEDVVYAVRRSLLATAVALATVLTATVPIIVGLAACTLGGTLATDTETPTIAYPACVFGGAFLAIALFLAGMAGTSRASAAYGAYIKSVRAQRSAKYAVRPEPVELFVVPMTTRISELVSLNFTGRSSNFWDPSPMVRPYVISGGRTRFAPEEFDLETNLRRALNHPVQM